MKRTMTEDASADIALFIARSVVVFGTCLLWLAWLWPHGMGAPANASGILALGAGLIWVWRRRKRDLWACGFGLAGLIAGYMLEQVSPPLGLVGGVGAAIAALILIYWAVELALGFLFD